MQASKTGGTLFNAFEKSDSIISICAVISRCRENSSIVVKIIYDRELPKVRFTKLIQLFRLVKIQYCDSIVWNFELVSCSNHWFWVANSLSCNCLISYIVGFLKRLNIIKRLSTHYILSCDQHGFRKHHLWEILFNTAGVLATRLKLLLLFTRHQLSNTRLFLTPLILPVCICII